MTRKEVQVEEYELEAVAHMGIDGIVFCFRDHQTVNAALRRLEIEELSLEEFTRIKEEIQDRIKSKGLF